MAAPGTVGAQDAASFRALCSWIDTQTNPTQLQSIITELQNRSEQCYFDPASGQNYCKACIELASQKLITLTATAAGPAPAPAYP